jgi:hypothetical protein
MADTSFETSILVLTIGAVVALGYVYGFWLSKTPNLKLVNSSSQIKNANKQRDLIPFVNYYKVPIQIRKDNNVFIEELLPNKKEFLKLEEVKKFFGTDKSQIRIYIKGKGSSTYNVLLNLTNLKVIDGDYYGLFVGQNSSHEDLGLIADPIRSSLGTAIPRLSLYNDTLMKLKFQIGSDQICLGPGEDRMYFGEEDHGIHLGTHIQNIDGILRDFVVDIPMTDLHLGLVLNHPTLLYTGAKIGGDFDDSIRIKTYPLELWGMDGPHRGMFSDKTFIL